MPLFEKQFGQLVEVNGLENNVCTVQQYLAEICSLSVN